MPHVIVAKYELPLCGSYHRSEGHCHSRTFVVHASGRMTQTEWLKAGKIRSRKGKDRSVKLGLQLNSFEWNGGPERFGRTLVEIARAAEEAGLDRIGVADHVWQHPIMGGPESNEPECYTTLAFLAANTERIRTAVADERHRGSTSGRLEERTRDSNAASPDGRDLNPT